MTDWDVLVVEDDDDSRDIVAEVLAEESLRVKAVSRVQDAMDLLATGSRVRVVLSDARMPGTSASSLFQALRSSADLKQIALVVMSGDETAVNEARALGADAAFVKPVGLDELIATIRVLVNSSLDRDLREHLAEPTWSA